MEQARITNYIMSDGSRTVAEVHYDRYPNIAAATGSSNREPGDKADRETGELLAVGRALVNLGKKLERRANGRMRHAETVKEHKEQIAVSKALVKEKRDLLAQLGALPEDFFPH